MEATPTFAQLGLSKQFLIEALKYFSFERPTPVQEMAVPLALQMRNAVVQAKNGTGKTLAFCLGLLELIDEGVECLQGVVVCPTREVALQVFDFINELSYSSASTIYTILCCGGYSRKETIKSLKEGVHIVVGTVGRLRDMLEHCFICLDQLKCFIMDEADALVASCVFLLRKLPENTVKLAFSATYTEPALSLLRAELAPAEVLKCSGEDTSLQNIQEFALPTENTVKSRITSTLKLLNKVNFHQAIIFCNAKATGDDLANRVRSGGFPCLFISGDLPQSQRLEVIRNLRYFSIRVLLSTDLTSRGLDILNVNLVLNFDVPVNKEVYLHRIGRCGRFGTPGLAVSLYTSAEDKTRLLSYAHALAEMSSWELTYEPNPLTEQEIPLLDSLRKDPLEWADVPKCGLCALHYKAHCHCAICIENYEHIAAALVNGLTLP